MVRSGPVVLMLHHGLGDVLIAVPMLKLLRERLPDTPLVVLVRDRHVAEFGRVAMPWLGADWEVIQRGHVRALAMGLGLARRRPSAFLGVHAKGRDAGLVALTSMAPLRVGPAKGRGFNVGVVAGSFDRHSVYDETRHKARVYADFLGPLGIDTGSLPHARLEIPETLSRSVRQRFGWLGEGRWMGLAPGCGLGPHKKWTAGGFAGVMAELRRDDPDLGFVLVGSPSDGVDAERIVAALPADFDQVRLHDLTGQTSMLEALAMMGELQVLLTVCNGSSHMGAAAGIPMVGLYGPTNPGFTGAFSERMHVVRRGYACSPCYRTTFNQGCGNPRCMLDIDPAEVVSMLQKALAGEPPRPVPILNNTEATEFRADAEGGVK